MPSSNERERERSALADLRQASERIFRAQGKLRKDSTAAHLSGQLTGAQVIIGAVQEVIASRTDDGSGSRLITERADVESVERMRRELGS